VTEDNRPWNKKLRSKLLRKLDGWDDVAMDLSDKIAEALKLDPPQSSKLYDILTFPTDHVTQFWICQLLNSHEGTMDHCGMPEHDFCIYCQTSMPYQGENIERRVRRKYCTDCADLPYLEYCDKHRPTVLHGEEAKAYGARLVDEVSKDE
jgi:hypothetical protein